MLLLSENFVLSSLTFSTINQLSKVDYSRRMSLILSPSAELPMRCITLISISQFLGDRNSSSPPFNHSLKTSLQAISGVNGCIPLMALIL